MNFTLAEILTNGLSRNHGNGSNNSFFTRCGDRHYYGGHGVLDSTANKSLTLFKDNLTNHNLLLLRFRFIRIYDWSSRTLLVTLDNKQIYRHTFNSSISPGEVSKSCVNSTGYESFINISFYHTSPNFTIIIYWNLTTSTISGSAAFREF